MLHYTVCQVRRRIVVLVVLLLMGSLSCIQNAYADASNHYELKDTCFCLNTPNREDYGDIFLWRCDGTDADQDWESVGNLIRLKGTNYCLNTPNRENYGDIFLWTCDSSDPDQQWVRDGDLVRLQGTHYCLNTPNRENYGDIFLWTCDSNDPDQKWRNGSNCNSGGCPDYGDYCGGSVGGNPAYLYFCTAAGAVPQLKDDCGGAGCQVNDPGVPDVCVSGGNCPDYGDYCGGSVGGNPAYLYFCTGAGAVPQLKDDCGGAGCQVNDPGTPDVCMTAGQCIYTHLLPRAQLDVYHDWTDNLTIELGQSFRVGALNWDSGDLAFAQEGVLLEVSGPSGFYQTPNNGDTITPGMAGQYTLVVSCGAIQESSRITVNGISSSCPGYGDYCGGSVGADPSYLYFCTGAGAAPQLKDDCGGRGCQVNDPGVADVCVPQESCPGYGDYCGGSVDANPSYLYFCSGAGAAPQLKDNCGGRGCQVNDPGVADVCVSPEGCPGYGDYCGGSVGANPSYLYFCAGAGVAPQLKDDCGGAGCQVNDPGIPDICVSTAGSGLELNRDALTVPEAGGSYTLDVINHESSSLDWSTQDVPSWVTLSQYSGTVPPNSTVGLTVFVDDTTESRNATLRFYNSADSNDEDLLRITQYGGGEHTYDPYFDEAGDFYDVPSNLLRALAYVESRWVQGSASGTSDFGVMQLHEGRPENGDEQFDALVPIATALINGWNGGSCGQYSGWEAYRNNTVAQIVELLKTDSDAGAEANIRGGAFWLRQKSCDPNLYPEEPRHALDVWWYPLMAYQGFPMADTRVSNYPFYVYNCFIQPERCEFRVPQIPITFPPHIAFRRVQDNPNSYADPFDTQLRHLDSYSAEVLLPTSPPFERNAAGTVVAGFVRVIEPFNSCIDMRVLHDNEGNPIRTEDIESCADVLQQQPEAFRLQFPLAGQTPYSATLTAIVDVIQDASYASDGYTMAYTGEYGKVVSGQCLNTDPPGAYTVNGNFVLSGNYADTTCLYYEGHPGVDYGIGFQTELYATANGIFHHVGGNTNQGYIDHGNGYTSHYLHSDSYSIQDGSQVTAGQLIGYSGHTGSPGAYHLHLEIRRNGHPVDPYGWQSEQDDAYQWTRATNSILWEAGISPQMAANTASPQAEKSAAGGGGCFIQTAFGGSQQ